MSINLGKGPDDWEIFQQGPTVVERTKLIADDNREYHRIKGTNAMNEGPLYDHSKYIHELGTQMLKVQKSTSVTTSSTANIDFTKLPKVRRIPRKKISVAEVEKSGKLIAMDLEWDTTSWSQEEIEGGCETLISLFQRPEANDAYEDQALKMLEKLMHRHAVAVTFMRKNIETLLSKTVSRRLHSSGKSGGILRLLKVINICTSRFAKELSTFNIVSRMLEMLLIEARLASIIIQHAFRVHLHKPRPEDEAVFDVGFGTRRDIELQMKHAVNARSSELKQKWKSMHISQTTIQRRRKYGIRGPVHVEEKYVKLMLKIIIFLVSDSAGQYATVNREDVVRSGGLILLSNLVYTINGPFCFDIARILTYISNIPDSLLPMLHTGCVNAILNYFKMLRRKEDKRNIKEMQEAITVIIRLGYHAAGLFRASGNYKYIRQPLSEAEELIDYRIFLMKLDREKLTCDLRNMLSSKEVVIELVQTIISCTYVPIVSVAVTCLFTLSCSECYSKVLDEILALGSRGLCRIVQLLEEVDVTVAMPSLYLILQLCTREDCRGGMTTSKLPMMLGAIVKDSSRYDEPNYQRAMLALTALCRRGEWRAYDPLELPSLFSNKNALINATYIDLMTMVKKPEPGENHDLGAMLVMLTDKESAKYLSTVAEKVGSSALCDFLCKPSDPRHFHTLPWTAAASGCSIIEALVLQPEAAARVISQATARYLGQCVYFSFLEISEHSFGEVKTKEMLYAVLSSLNALHNLCFAASELPEEAQRVQSGVIESHVIQASVFFAMTLSTIHPSLGQYPALKKMQQKVGLKAIYFLDSYAQLLLDTNAIEELSGMGSEIGSHMCEILGSLLTVYGTTSEMWNILDRLCRLLAKLILPPSSVYASLRGWKLPQALHIHLPPPLGNLSLALSTGSAEVNKIVATPATYFEVLANIAVIEQGKVLVFSDGFLRRALEKLSLSIRGIENEEELELWVMATKTRGADNPTPSNARLEVTSCLRVINNCANFSSPKYGNSNDLILQSDYNVIGIAVSLLSSAACPRSDVAVFAALNTIFVFSKDVVLVSEEFERLDVIEVIKNEFNRYEELSEEYSKICVEIMLNMATGLRGSSSARRLSNMREEVFRVSRLFPSLCKLVQNALWMMTKDSLQNKIDNDPLPGSIEELLKYAAAEEAAGEKNKKLEEAKRLDDEAADEEDEHHHGRQGTYDFCGTTSCGSLRLPLTSNIHGSYAKSPLKPSTDNHPLQYFRIPLTEGSCDVSKESARSQGLKDELYRRKYLFGFADKETPRAENEIGIITGNTAKSLPDVITSKSFANLNTSKNKDANIFMDTKTNNNRSNNNKNKSKLRGKLDIIINSKEYNCNRPPVVIIDVSEIPELKMTRPPPRKSGGNIL